MIFIYYPRCSTCMKAKKWLDDHNIAYTERHITENPPSADELRVWHQLSGLPLKRFFNTSGIRYRELNLKEMLPALNDGQQYELLASDALLVKRPLLINGERVCTGFKESEWSTVLKEP